MKSNLPKNGLRSVRGFHILNQSLTRTCRRHPQGRARQSRIRIKEMTSLVSLTYADKTQTVALFEGLSPAELTSVLQTVFGFSGDVVGILGEVSAIL